MASGSLSSAISLRGDGAQLALAPPLRALEGRAARRAAAARRGGRVHRAAEDGRGLGGVVRREGGGGGAFELREVRLGEAVEPREAHGERRGHARHPEDVEEEGADEGGGGGGGGGGGARVVGAAEADGGGALVRGGEEEVLGVPVEAHRAAGASGRARGAEVPVLKVARRLGLVEGAAAQYDEAAVVVCHLVARVLPHIADQVDQPERVGVRGEGLRVGRRWRAPAAHGGGVFARVVRLAPRVDVARVARLRGVLPLER
mmetsp:Transcript_14469/g.34410  ORF Transcript_14469/g.34410 Transcript_14469/m.34410 type:complete len:260 (+) Transcript_14469:295-1074(+)